MRASAHRVQQLPESALPEVPVPRAGAVDRGSLVRASGFFLPVRVLSRFFRRRFLQLLGLAFDRGELQFCCALQPLRERKAFQRYLDPLREKEWVVYSKAPFAGPEQVLDYVGRYTHRVAISNNRLLNIEAGQVTFRWRDYRDGDTHKSMTLSAGEFIRRFLLHVLPPGLQRIRYYGLLGNRHRQEKLEQCRRLLDMGLATPKEIHTEALADYRDRYQALTGVSLRECPLCRRGRMILIEQLAPSRGSGPPVLLDTS